MRAAPIGVLEENDMTPQERQLMAELFTRLASLENSPRDPDAEAMIREGFRRAPNAAYSLVQTVLVQDEALKAANNRIQDYEQQFGGPQQAPQEQRGFLDNMRDSFFGREEPPRGGSVPRVPQGGGAPMGAPPGYGSGDPWSRGAAPGQGYAQQGYGQPGYGQGQPMQAPPQQGGGGSSFLGTAAAAAAGVIGGSLLMNGIRSAMAGHQGGGHSSKAFEDFGNRDSGGGAPWSGGGSGDLARDAGLNDIGRSGAGGGEAKRSSLFDQAEQDRLQDEQQDAEEGFDDGGDFGDTDEI
jgi:hypothetical protein